MEGILGARGWLRVVGRKEGSVFEQMNCFFGAGQV
jgi:hypothetical protein